MAQLPITGTTSVDINSALTNGGLTTNGVIPAVNNSQGSNTALAPGQFNDTPAVPTSVVGTGPAMKVVDQAKNTITQHDTAVSAIKPPDDPSNKYNTSTGQLNTNYTGYIPPTPLTPPPTQTPEEKLLSQPDTGNQFVYNQYTGEQKEIPQGVVPQGYSTQNPTQRTDVADTVVDDEGNTIKKFSDGTYGRFDSLGNYSIGSEAMFNDIQNVNDVTKDLLNLRNGILTPAQQSQVDDITKQYKDLIDKQTVANANFTGGTTVAQNMFGIGNTTIGAGNIKQTIMDGANAIAKLQTQMSTAVDEMKRGFLTDDENAVKDAYDIYNTSRDAIQKKFDAIQTNLQNQTNKVTAAQTAINDSYARKYYDTTTPILSTDTPAQLQAKLQTSASYIQDQKTKAASVDQDVLDGMLKIYNKTGQIPAGMGNASVALKRAFYAQIGNAPALADDATKNKAALTAATKSLSTQQTQYNATQTSVGTLKSSMDRVDKYIAPLVDSGSPLLNQPLRSISGKVLGNANYNAFQNEMNTIATEYAKILSGSSASIAGVSVQSVEDIKKAFNDNVTIDQLNTVLDAMRQDVNARLVSQKGIIDQVQNDIKDLGTTDTGSNNTDSTPVGLAENW